MNIAVCVKQVPATDSRIKPIDPGEDIDRTGLAYVVNPYDEFGLEAALQLKVQFPPSTVTVLTLAPEKGTEVLRTCLAVGADRATHLKDPAFAYGDAYSTATVLAAALKQGSYDIIFFGKQAIDDDGGAVGIHVAEFMGLPHLSVITQLAVSADQKKATAHRQIEGAVEVAEVLLPAVFTCHKGMNEPRYATLAGIIKAKQKPITTLALADLGLSESQVGSRGARLIVETLALPPARQGGTILDGDPDQAVAELVRLLHEEARIL
jgi:electron transfer flavoprotein beta subunit